MPDWMGTLINVRELWIWGNELEGTIPDLSGMTGLDRLKLQNNLFSGGIPLWFGELRNLRYLYLHHNPLGGTIPAELGNLTNLRYLWLHNNMLEGDIPAELGQLSSLWDLNLHTNQLTGPIPAELGGMDRLQRLRLHRNMLDGEIPASLGGLDSLRFMWLHGNMLSGQIPTGLGRLRQLERLWLSENELEGQIPYELGYLRNLAQWRLADNQFTGCLPINISGVNDTDLAGLGLQVCDVLVIEAPLKIEPIIPNLRALIRPRVAYTGNDRLSYSLVGGPEEMSIDFNIGIIDWTPQESDGGRTFDITVRVNDGSRFAETVFPVSVIQPQELEIEIMESEAALLVTDTDTNLNGLQTASPPDESPMTSQTLHNLQQLFTRVPSASVPEIPSRITRISDVLLIKGVFDNPVEFRFPIDEFPEDVSLDDINLYAYVNPTDVDEYVWMPLVHDWSFTGSESEPIFVLELTGLGGMAFFGYHYTSPPTPFSSSDTQPSYTRKSLGLTSTQSVDTGQINCEAQRQWFSFSEFGEKNYNKITCRYTPDSEVKITIKSFGQGRRWDRTVEELAEWVITAQFAFEELDVGYDKEITVNIDSRLIGSDVRGQVYGSESGTLHLSPAMRASEPKGVLYHEYVHHVQFHRDTGNRLFANRANAVSNWLFEGSATWIADEIDDNINLYQDSLERFIMHVGLGSIPDVSFYNGVRSDVSFSYSTALFFLLLSHNCEDMKPNVRDLFVDQSDNDQDNGIVSLSEVVADSDCNFGDHLGSERSSYLSTAIAYYDYAMLFKNDIREVFDERGTIPVQYFVAPERFLEIRDLAWQSPFTHVEWPLTFSRSEFDYYDEIQMQVVERIVTEPIDIIPAAGTYSFKIPYGKLSDGSDVPYHNLPDGTVAELVVSPARGELIVSVTCLKSDECSSSENRQAFRDINTIGPDEDQHAWFSTAQSNSYILATERLPSLHITIVNPSLTEDVDVEVKLVIRREGSLLNRLEFTSHSDGELVSNRVIAVGGVFPEEVRDQVNRVVVTANGLRSGTVMRSDGTFWEQVIMFAGDNIITAQGFNGETPVTQAARITLIGVPVISQSRNQLVSSRVGIVLRWDTGTTDVDIYSTDKDSRTIYFSNKVEYPGFLDFDDLEGYGPEVISYRAVEHSIYNNGTFDVDVHYFSGSPPTNFTLDVILNETEADNRRLHRYESVTPLTQSDNFRNSGPHGASGPSRFNSLLTVSCNRQGVCLVNSVDESKLAPLGESGGIDDSSSSSERSDLRNVYPETELNASPKSK